MVEPNVQLLSQPCDTAVVLAGTDALHIPIEILEGQLDAFHFSTKNFQWRKYRTRESEGIPSNEGVAASIELHLVIAGPETDMGIPQVQRSFVGACNFLLKDLLPITDWLGTAKSLCIKNAASDAGTWLGRSINKSDILPARKSARKERNPIKGVPDANIRKQYVTAIADNNSQQIQLLESMYEFKI